MAFDPRYVVDTTLQPHFINKTTGLSLANGAVYFYKDNDRNTAKPVFQLTGSPPNYTYSVLPNPLPLNSVGLPQVAENQIAFYYLPYNSVDGSTERYYVEVYAEGDSPGNGTPQLTREAWPNTPDIAASTTVSVTNTQNVLDNPQFVDVLFDPTTTLTISFTGNSETVVEIAPSWELVIDHSSAGTVTVARTAIAGTQDIPTQPAYTLTITGSPTVERLWLRQRLSNNSGIWSMVPNITSGYVAANATLQTGTELQIRYQDSLGNSQTLLDANNTSGLFAEYTSTTLLNDSVNSQTATSGYVDIIIDLMPTSVNTFTSLQVIGLSTNVTNVGFYAEPANRQRDHLFGFYNPLLQYKPLPSYLIGWDFALNPAQFGGATQPETAIGANKSKYVWDQTIIFQEQDSGVAVQRGDNGALRLTAKTADGQMAIVQYVETSVARELLNDEFAINIAAKTSQANGYAGNVSVWYTSDASLPDITSNNSVVLSLDASGKPASQNGNWTEVPRSNLGDADFTVATSATNEFNDYRFTGWNMQGAAVTNTATFVAIVVGFATVTVDDTIDIHSVSLVSGRIPTRPAPKSLSETQLACMRYYEKSYQSDVAPGAVTGDNCLTETQAGDFLASAGTYTLYNSAFGFQYQVEKLTDSPSVSIYSPLGGAAGNVEGNVWGVGAAGFGTASQALATYWVTSTISNKGAQYQPGATVPTAVQVSSGAGSGQGVGWIRYHYVVDARLGTF